MKIEFIKDHYPISYIDDPFDIFYFTKCRLSKGRLIVGGGIAILLVDGRYIEASKKVANVEVDIDSMENIKKYVNGKDLSVAISKIAYREVLYLQKCGATIVGGDLESLRRAKSAAEKAAIIKSIKLNNMGMEFLMGKLKEGVSELEISWEFEKFCKERGASALSFDPIVAFGENSSMPHHHSSDRRLKYGDPVTIDVGVIVDDYHSDSTRSFLFSGENSDYKKIEESVVEAQSMIMDICRAGIEILYLQEKFKEFLQKRGLSHLCKHSLGHGIGLECHEPPFLSSKNGNLESGDVITIEPGLYCDSFFGYRKEDIIEITMDGYICYSE